METLPKCGTAVDLAVWHINFIEIPAANSMFACAGIIGEIPLSVARCLDNASHVFVGDRLRQILCLLLQADQAMTNGMRYIMKVYDIVENDVEMPDDDESLPQNFRARHRISETLHALRQLMLLRFTGWLGAELSVAAIDKLMDDDFDGIKRDLIRDLLPFRARHLRQYATLVAESDPRSHRQAPVAPSFEFGLPWS